MKRVKSATKRMWAVSSGSYSDYRVLCACPTRKDAVEVARKVCEAGSWHSDARVEEFMLVTAAVEQQPVLQLLVTLWDDGTEEGRREQVRNEWPFDSIFDVVPMSWRWVRAPMHNNKGGRLEVEGTDHDLVRRTFSDKRAQILADDALRLAPERKGRVLSPSSLADPLSDEETQP